MSDEQDVGGRDRPDRALDLFDLARDLEEQGVALPVLLRFSDILQSRIESLSELEGDLAESWEISDDGLTYTFHLRDDVTWHDIAPVNGRPFVAQDVVASMNRVKSVGVAAYMLERVERIEATDDLVRRGRRGVQRDRGPTDPAARAGLERHRAGTSSL